MTAVDQFEQFAKAYGDPTSPTYNNATETYHFLNPHVTRDSAKKAGSRMLKDARVKQHLLAYRRRMGVLASHSHEDYLAKGWEAFEQMTSLMVTDAKYAGAVAKMFEVLGKGHGYLLTKTEDMTPLERKVAISPAEARTLLEQRMEKSTAMYDRINTPLPLPAASASAIIDVPASPVDEEPEHTILPRETEPAHESPEAPLDAVHEG